MAKDRIKNYAQGTSEINILKDIRTDLSVAPSSYTPDTSTVTRDRLVTFAQAEEELAVLGDIEKGVKQQVVKGDIADKRITNIEKLLQGNLYDYQTDSTSGYTKSVPAGAMPYAGIEQIGGKTVVWNQLATSKGTQSGEFGGVNYAFDGYKLHYYNTSPSTVIYNEMIKPAGYFADKVGHKMLITAPSGGSGSTYRVRMTGSSSVVVYQTSIVTVPSEWATGTLYFTIASGVVLDVEWYNQIHDLTLMFGKGNEPSTVEEFEAMFPADYYAYNAGELLSAGVTEVVSKDSNNATLQTYSIPAEVQALEGYGWSAGNVYNYIDFERKVFVQNVARVDLGTLTWKASSTAGRYYATAPQYKYTNTTQMVCGRYVFDGYGMSGIRGYYGADKTIRYLVKDIPTYEFYIHDDSVSDVATLQASLNGVYMYYALATPVETDVSAYLTDDNLINVESGGTLTFPNSNGDDYRLPVPSEETYMIDLQSALGE